MMVGLKKVMEIGVGDQLKEEEEEEEEKKDFQFPCTIEIHFQETDVKGGQQKSGKEQQQQQSKDEKRRVNIINCAGLQLLPTPIQSIDSNPVYFAQLLKNDRMTPQDHFQDVRHISLKISSNKDGAQEPLELNKLTNIKFNPGDVCMMHPRNDPKITRQFIQFLGYNPESVVVIKQIRQNLSKSPFEIKLPFDAPITLQHLFEYWVNFQGVPTRQFPQELIRYAKEDSKHLEKLKQFCTKTVEGKSEFYRYCKKEKRTFFEFLWDFNQVKCPLPRLLELIGNIHPRQFSISSSPSKHPSQLHLTVAIVKYKTPSVTRQKIGLCSEYISKLMKIGQHVPIWIKAGTLKIYNTPSIKYNYIFVGPGTGVAPIKSFVDEIDFRTKQQQQDSKVLLFFGNRNKSKDYLYQKDWEQLEKKDFFNIVCAWSRDNEQRKVYVHHKIKQSEEKVKEIFKDDKQEKTIIYVCGRSKSMPKAVEIAFKEILGKDKIDMMKKRGLYKLQAW